MAENQPLVSVCIPLYNAHAFIADTLGSVLNQTYPNWELIIVDDLSTDGSWEIVSGCRDPRVRCVRNEKRLGAGGNLNKAISEAKGIYIKLLCHDDLLVPRCLERQVAAFLTEGNRSVSLVSCARDIINQQGKLTLRRQWFRGDRLVDGASAVRAMLRAGTNLIGEPSAALFKADDARRIGPLDGSYPYVIDLDYWFRLMAVGDLYYIAESLCSFRISRQSWSSRLVGQQRRQFTGLMVQTWRSGVYGVTGWDVLCGFVLSKVNGIARRVWVFFRA